MWKGFRSERSARPGSSVLAATSTLAAWTLLVLLTAHPLPARAAEEPNVPPDTCIVELDLPEGATVTVDGRDYGSQQRLVFRAGSTTD